MSLKTRVKVGRVTNLSEARYCAGMGVDLLGFPVGEEGHGGHVGLTAEQYRQMIEWVAGPELVLEVHQSKTLDLHSITDNYPGHYVEIGRAQMEWLSERTVNFILAIEARDWVNVYGDLMGLENVKYVELLNASRHDASAVRAISTYFPVLLNIASANQLADIMKLNAAGIAINGSDEEKPGIKDYGKVAEILEALDID